MSYFCGVSWKHLSLYITFVTSSVLVCFDDSGLVMKEKNICYIYLYFMCFFSVTIIIIIIIIILYGYPNTTCIWMSVM